MTRAESTIAFPADATNVRGGLLAPLRELFTFGEVLQELVKRDLKVRYKRSVLGVLWTMLNPLLMMIITSIVFSSLFRNTITNFPVYVFSGYLVWTFFSQATVSASSSILDSAGLTRKVYVPASLFPLACIAAGLINLALAVIPLCLLMLVTGAPLSWAIIILPFSAVLLGLFAYGVGLVLSAAAVFFRDAVYTYQVVLVAWMYLTPLFYPEQIIPERWRLLLYLNPVYYMVQLFRQPIYSGILPDALTLIAAILFTVVALGLGWWFFDSSRKRFVAYL